MRPTTKEEFIELYNTKTYLEMCEELQTCAKTIAKYAKKMGLKKPVGRRGIPQKITEEPSIEN